MYALKFSSESVEFRVKNIVSISLALEVLQREELERWWMLVKVLYQVEEGNPQLAVEGTLEVEEEEDSLVLEVEEEEDSLVLEEEEEKDEEEDSLEVWRGL